jgi:DNA-binding NarL/FixJ family response regulator
VVTPDLLGDSSAAPLDRWALSMWETWFDRIRSLVFAPDEITTIRYPLAVAPRYDLRMVNGMALADPSQREGLLRILVVDDHDVLRAGTRQVLDTADDLVVVGEAADGAAALDMVDELQPDVVLIDLRLPDRNGIDVARELTATHPNIRLVILSAYDDDVFVRAAFTVGVTGYLLKTMPCDELIGAVRAAGQGTTVLDPALSVRLAGARNSRGTEDGSQLTWRERETVELVAQGLANRAVAARLGVSVRTVEGHLNHAFAKLGVESRTELVRLVLNHGHVKPPQSSHFEG